MEHPGHPPAQGLFDGVERDACGVGFVCNMKGKKSHKIVEDALKILVNLKHRGACGCEANTGDGAGLLIQIPHAFLKREMAKQGVVLPEPGEYGVASVFLPPTAAQRQQTQILFEKAVRKEGQIVLGWRKIPQDDKDIGPSAQIVEPDIRQFFIGRAANVIDEDAFERKLFLIRKRAESKIAASDLIEKKFFYVPSCSCRTLIYKGMLNADQMESFFTELHDPAVESALALVHQRFSTNTFPTWSLAHPFRYLAHNGEINTLRGNINWMRARQGLFESDLFTKEEMERLMPVCIEGGSDSAILDNALEMLVMCGRSLPHAMMMLIPEAWSGHESMSQSKKDFYEFHSCMMEPWDGPASVAFTDGRVIGAVLDRNGLRPSRYYVTKDDMVVMASEVGVLPGIKPEDVVIKGRLQPGKMFLIDLKEGRIIDDAELKEKIASEKPYGEWLNGNLIELDALPDSNNIPEPDHSTVFHRQQAFGYTVEDLRILMTPMALNGEEPIGSMGTDTPLAVLSDKPQPLYSYFKQLFAQVTNPPLDAIREELVTSVATSVGPEGNILKPGPDCCKQIKLTSPILDNHELAKLRHISVNGYKTLTLPMLFEASTGGEGLRKAIESLCQKSVKAIEDGYKIIILSDRGVDKTHAPIPALLATAGVHHHLVRNSMRTKVGLVIESGEPREVHHFALLIGYGAGAINPYLAFESFDDMIRDGLLPGIEHKTAIKNFNKAVKKGVVKVMSKMGISTVHSYRGAQIFEAVGLNKDVVDKYFTGTASRIEGIGFDVIAEETLARHRRAYPERDVPVEALDIGGQYQWRRDGEFHLFNPETVHKLQFAVRSNNYKVFKEYSRAVDDQSKRLCTLRGLFDIRTSGRPAVPLSEVESAIDIVKRFATGAMSYGSISKEAHENLAIAMNRIGGKSNTGEGGEDYERFGKLPNGDTPNSAIKQVASARFGVTSMYLVNAQELQIKMAQGAKPGEGGQLPAHKVYPWIAKTRHSTPFVGLISPPPHHDIYSIEDLAQLIHDLKNSNKYARVAVKLVAEVGVGTVAAGVSKAHSDVVLIAGHDGGTGASPLTSIKHAGAPWELGLAETQQTLVLNDLRSRIVVQADGQMKTGRDVVIAALLGAEEFGFATAPLVASGCIMMRVCHLDTCPVGVATQNPELRKKFMGAPEHVVNFMMFIAEEVRELMAQLGFRTINEMVGRSDLLDMKAAINHWKAKGLDFSSIFHKPEPRGNSTLYRSIDQDHGLQNALDNTLIERCHDALDSGQRVEFSQAIRNVNRTVGTMLGSELTRKHGELGLPDDTITIRFKGSAGQSFGAFMPRGITFDLEGDANDYVGKGLSGAKIIVRPSKKATFDPKDNIIAGNVILYGATAGEMYLRGVVGERFCVRNSGALAVVEGVGDHGCEYMTNGRVVVLGKTGRNFAAGMSGGIAYVYDPENALPVNLNKGMVELEKPEMEDLETIKTLIENHKKYTGSTVAAEILANWRNDSLKFQKVMPVDFKRVLKQQREAATPVKLAAAGE
ncbi:MAG TPA: glutamate synthase large subunit [Planctomycetota bacterium]|nr:glutamate synthase large subunit [Planctomycetota bacterium]